MITAWAERLLLSLKVYYTLSLPPLSLSPSDRERPFSTSHLSLSLSLYLTISISLSLYFFFSLCLSLSLSLSLKLSPPLSDRTSVLPLSLFSLSFLSACCFRQSFSARLKNRVYRQLAVLEN
jgi:hypothetical protein